MRCHATLKENTYIQALNIDGEKWARGPEKIELNQRFT